MELMGMEQALKAIRKRQYTESKNGMDVLMKPIPETDERGILDERYYQSQASILSGLSGMVLRPYIKSITSPKKDMYKSAGQYRKMVAGPEPATNENVRITKSNVQGRGGPIPIRIYQSKTQKEGLRPVLYYIHGGGFIGSGMNETDELCQKMVLLSGFVVVQLDYRLAPENPFPASLDDCYTVLKWTYEHAQAYGGDPEKICISGDSAGGNLATVCAMKDRDEGLSTVKAQGLLFPVTDLAHTSELSQKSRKEYQIAPGQKKIIGRLIDVLGSMLNGRTMDQYLSVKDATNPMVSPALGNLAGMPPAIILLGEYDFFLLDNDRYAKKLKDAGVAVELVHYHGLSHGFTSRFETNPQAVDALLEMSRFFEYHFTQSV